MPRFSFSYVCIIAFSQLLILLLSSFAVTANDYNRLGPLIASNDEFVVKEDPIRRIFTVPFSPWDLNINWDNNLFPSGSSTGPYSVYSVADGKKQKRKSTNDSIYFAFYGVFPDGGLIGAYFAIYFSNLNRSSYMLARLFTGMWAGQCALAVDPMGSMAYLFEGEAF